MHDMAAALLTGAWVKVCSVCSVCSVLRCVLGALCCQHLEV